MDSLRTLKIARNGYIAIAVVVCVFGVCLLINPDYYSADILIRLLGVIFIADGIIKMIGYFSKDFYCLAFQYDFAFGILMCALGLLILVRGSNYAQLLYVILGLVILMDALLRIQMSLDAKKFGLHLWGQILLVAILTGVFGMILVIDPYNGEGITRTLTGTAVLLEGVLNLCVAVYTVKILDRFSGQEGGRMIKNRSRAKEKSLCD
ncbi:MAG: DUF308 domain-containing protein [Lachnospiraceae bacterium]|nr:DUF308 domain-containing protein [Lachnospiraceae bacterium]